MEDYIRIGKINKRIKDRFKLELIDGDEVFILQDRLDDFVSRWPDSYLIKISEAKNIIKSPMYLAYDDKTLYFVREYIKNQQFIKVGVEIDIKNQPHLNDIFVLTSKHQKNLKWILWTR